MLPSTITIKTDKQIGVNIVFDKCGQQSVSKMINFTFWESEGTSQQQTTHY